jgi:hypothetical protein
MNQVELNAAIERANRIFSNQYRPDSDRRLAPDETEIEQSQCDWPQASLNVERRFHDQLHARLFPFIGRKVRTPGGPGTLIQVFAERATVMLEVELSKCAWFHPTEVVPVGPESE